MELLVHIIQHSIEDTLPLIPFLFVTYLVLELLEHMAASRARELVRRAGAAGPVVGALLGVIPQCGFSAMGATLYAGRVITLGTLIAVFLSTSDEMVPLLVAERVDAATVAGILAAKALIAAGVGLAADACLRALRRNPRVHAALRRGILGPQAIVGERDLKQDVIEELAEAGEGVDHIHRLCMVDHCGCDEPEDRQGHVHEDHDHPGHTHAHQGAWGIVRSALSHTVQVTLFIFVVTLVLVAVLETVGEGALAAVLGGSPVLAVFASALVGLIPNCAASVAVTQLYLEGVLSLGAMLAGTLVGAGTGFLVLFRTNRSARENIVILVLLYAAGVVVGLVCALLGL